jgi:hypothetical protein
LSLPFFPAGTWNVGWPVYRIRDPHGADDFMIAALFALAGNVKVWNGYSAPGKTVYLSPEIFPEEYRSAF